MITEKIVFTNSRGVRIVGRIQREEPMSRRGVIFSHGLFSTKDGYKITRLASDLVQAGYTLFTYDFSFVGESGGNIADLSIIQEVDDLACAVRCFRTYGIDRITLMGSSMGGTVSLLYAADRPETVTSVVLIATPVDLKTLLIDHAGIADVDALPIGGKTEIQGIAIGNGFFREAKRIDAKAAAMKMAAPALVIHGAQDAIVDVGNARFLEEFLPGGKRLVIIGDGDHHLTRESDIRIILAQTVDWLHLFN